MTGIVRTRPSLAPCSPPSRPLRAACGGGLRPVLTAAVRGVTLNLGRDEETTPRAEQRTGRRSLGCRFSFLVDRPGERASDPRAGRRAALFCPHRQKNRMGGSTRRTAGRPAPGPGAAAGHRPADADERHLYPGDGVQQSGPALLWVATVDCAVRAHCERSSISAAEVRMAARLYYGHLPT